MQKKSGWKRQPSTRNENSKPDRRAEFSPREFIKLQVTSARVNAMDTLRREELRDLAERRQAFCVSVFLPTHRGGPETRQDPIRLKNLIKLAEREMVLQGQRPAAARETLAPMRRLAGDGEFWREQEKGLALFACDGWFRHFRLPLEFSERVTVGGRFQISPVLPLFAEGGSFYLLALSRNRVRFFRGTPTDLAELQVPGLPKSVDDALKYDVREAQSQVHSGAPASLGGKEAGVFTGQGVGVDDEEIRTKQFLLQVERAARQWLKDQHAPLLLAGVEELVAEYRSVNKYGTLLDDSVAGNPDLVQPHQLQAEAWPKVLPHFQTKRKKALSSYQELSGAGRAAHDVKPVLAAASAGRVDAAFLPAGVQKWGKYDATENRAEPHDARQPGDEDLIDRIAVETALHRGSVYLIPPDEMPDGKEAAAVLRY